MYKHTNTNTHSHGHSLWSATCMNTLADTQITYHTSTCSLSHTHTLTQIRLSSYTPAHTADLANTSGTWDTQLPTLNTH